MDFSWTEHQDKIADDILRFAEVELRRSDARDSFDFRQWNKCSAFGLLGASLSREDGGLGYDCLTTAHMFEYFGRGCQDCGLGLSIGAHVFAVAMPLARFGTMMAREAYLFKLATGRIVAANGITEPQAGSDIYALQTVARRVKGGYVMTGEKIFVTNGPVAGLFLIYARTSDAAGVLGLSAFLIDREAAGVKIGPTDETIGLRSSPSCRVSLRDCFVPDSMMLGAEGSGSLIFDYSMLWERTCLFSFFIGIMERQLSEVIQHARTRIQFGQPIGTQQTIAHRIVDMKLRLDSARWLLLHASWEIDQRRPNHMHVSMAKLAVSEAAILSSLDAIQIFGGQGILVAAGIERYLRDLTAGTIFSGTSEMHRNMISHQLGLRFKARKSL